MHYSVIEIEGYKSLREGQQVTFELECGPKGDHATKVVTLNMTLPEMPLSEMHMSEAVAA